MKLHTIKTRKSRVFKICKKSKTRRGVGGNIFTDLVSRFRGTPKPPQSPLNVSSNSAVVAVSQEGTDLGTFNLKNLFKGDAAFTAYLDELQKKHLLIDMPRSSIVKVFKKLTFKGIKRYVCFNLTYAVSQRWMTDTMEPILLNKPQDEQLQLSNRIYTETLDHITTNPYLLFSQFRFQQYITPNIVFFKNKPGVVCSVTNNDVNVTEIIKTFIKYFILCFNCVVKLYIEDQDKEQQQQQNDLAVQQAERATQQGLQTTAMTTAKGNMQEIMQVIDSLEPKISDERKQEIETKKTKLLSALDTNKSNLIKRNTISMILVLLYIELSIKQCKQYPIQDPRYTECSHSIAYSINFKNQVLDNQNITELLTELNGVCARIKGSKRSPPVPSSPVTSVTSTVPPPVTSVTSTVPPPVTSVTSTVPPVQVQPESQSDNTNSEEVTHILTQIEDITAQIGILLEKRTKLNHRYIELKRTVGGVGGSKKTKKTKHNHVKL